MDEVRIVDTTLRDGDISLWAYGMTTGMMLPALRHMDEAGFDSMEFFLSLRFKKFVREHKEDPRDWLRLGTKVIKKTRFTPGRSSSTRSSSRRRAKNIWPARKPLVRLVEEIAKNKLSHVYIRNCNFSLTVQRGE